MKLPIGTKLKPTRAAELLHYHQHQIYFITDYDEAGDYVITADHLKGGKDYFFRDDLDYFFEVIV